MKGGAHLSPFAALSYPESKRYPFTAGLTKRRVFQSFSRLSAITVNTLRVSKGILTSFPSIQRRSISYKRRSGPKVIKLFHAQLN